MTTLADGIAAYRIFAQAEGKSPSTIKWIMSSVTYFSNYGNLSRFWGSSQICPAIVA